MSKRSELEEMTLRAQTLADLLDGHHGAQVSCDAALTISRTATRKAVRLAEEANERASRAEQQVADRDVENVTLAKRLEVATNALAEMPATIATIRRVVIDHIVSGRTGSSTAAMVLAGSLQTEMHDAGQSVDAEVTLLAQLEPPR